ncbi:MmgE/PrpD family protein [Paracoccus aerodenitrificans]|uniref:MmgE/PrpD family protein n=1 Tax=Paracoccus aerodenitrificans TaxID=3017781 RepID=UPI0022F00F2A|nr:MmgE/PrpD family protein [Paracoccus aerodenitrificans]WBU62770.1 MmgE/PrpD family protein [Paracoccus aerodenitrificans]
MKYAREGSLIDMVVALAAFPRTALPDRARRLAGLSLLDWMACGLAAVDEPLAIKLRRLIGDEAGRGVASVLGGRAAPARAAALVNGATSHALDYDDTHFAHIGHLSVGIYPAALAAGEERGATATQVVDAFLLGAESAIRIGLVLGSAHYNLGFHQTATAGAFGATVAAGRLYGLDEGQMRAALGLCATRASGLKSQFGTMGKPYNAGIAASNGVECAALAALGMSSADDGLMGVQGFVPTHSPKPDASAGLMPPPEEAFLFGDNKYKLHACCHGTHAMIEAIIGSEDLKGSDLGNVAGLEVRANPRWLRVCDLKTPRTGLEVKFSYAWLAGMAIRGDRTGDDGIYTNETASDTALADFAGKVTVTGDDRLSDMQAGLTVTLRDGTRLELAHDLDAVLPEQMLADKLRNKAEALLGTAGQTLWQRFEDLDGVTARDLGAFLGSRES